MANAKEFYFPFKNIWWRQLLFALGAAAVMSLVLFLLHPVISRFVGVAAAAFVLAAWVQMIFLNGKMVSLTGEEITISSFETVVNLLIWCAIISGKRKKNELRKHCTWNILKVKNIGRNSSFFPGMRMCWSRKEQVRV